MDTPFRVRHLQSVGVRNLNISVDDLSRSTVFFALSTIDQDNIGYFYESSKCDNVLNPYWENLDLSYETIRRFSFLDNFIITFFVNKNNKNKLIVEIKVHISGLSPLNSLSLNHTKNDDKCFLFQFNSIIYSFDVDEPSTRSTCLSDGLRKAKLAKPLYDKETINKFMHTLSAEYQQHLSTITSERQTLELQIYQCKHQISVIIAKRSAIATYESQIQLARKISDAKQKELFQNRRASALFREKMNRVSDYTEKVTIDILRNHTLKKRHRDSYLKISNEYMLRMYQLIHELARVFPITPTELQHNDNQPTTVIIKSTDKLSIVNLHLPNNDKQIILTQDVSSFAALGMVFQLLSALSQIYDIPMRYPLKTVGYKAMIRDNIIEIEDNERNFLLIKNSSENFRLQYAIYLLNLNIVAIRGYFSLSTKYPDRTLWNINTLIEGKNRILGSSSSENGSSSNLTMSTNNNQSLVTSIESPLTSRPSHKLSPLVTNNYSAVDQNV